MKNKHLFIFLALIALTGCNMSDGQRVEQAALTLEAGNKAVLVLHEQNAINDDDLLVYDAIKDETELVLAAATVDLQDNGKIDNPKTLFNLKRLIERVKEVARIKGIRKQ